MNYDDDVVRAGRAAAATVAKSSGFSAAAAQIEAGERDWSADVQSACIAITAERQGASIPRDAANPRWQPITESRNGIKALYGCWHEGRWFEVIATMGKGAGAAVGVINVPVGFRKYARATHFMLLPAEPEVENDSR